MKIQPRIVGKHRIRTHGAVEERIREAIEDAANEFDCSKSFIQSVALADFFGIKLDYDYREEEKKPRRHKARNRSV